MNILKIAFKYGMLALLIALALTTILYMLDKFDNNSFKGPGKNKNENGYYEKR